MEIDNSLQANWSNWKTWMYMRWRSFAVWWIVPDKWLRFQSELHKNNKIQQAPFTAGQHWITGAFFLKSQAMDEEMLIWNHFPQRLSWPAPKPFQPLLHHCKVLNIYLNLLLSHFFSFAFSFVIQFVLWINRILTTLVEILRWQWRFPHDN